MQEKDQLIYRAFTIDQTGSQDENKTTLTEIGGAYRLEHEDGLILHLEGVPTNGKLLLLSERPENGDHSEFLVN